jgi:diguanylate cyclase (GGDEF)-like protein
VAEKLTHPLALWGEFASRDQEAEYLAERLPENLRHLRLVFLAAAILNVLFLFSDWRFYGQPHFPVAIVSRAFIVLPTLAGLLLVQRVRCPRGLQRLCLGWCVFVIPACAALVSPQSEAALVTIFMLPAIFYLTLPVPFRLAVASGAVCSAATLGSHLWNAQHVIATRLGVGLGLLTMNVVLALVLVRMSRLQRLEWAASRAEQAANQELSEHRCMLQSLLRAVPAPLVILARGTGELIQANDAARAYFGQEVLEKPHALAQCFEPGELSRLAVGGRACGLVAERERRLHLPDGSCRDVLLVTSSTELAGGEAVLAIVVDITTRKEMEQQLKRLASTDPLTGLANRVRFFALAAEELRRMQRYERPLAALMVDIDHFKHINDEHGHEAGDLALRTFGALCRTLVREADVVGRIGGEEFALLLPETGQERARALAERLRGAVEGLRDAGLCCPMTVSIGVAGVLPGEVSVEAALSRADAALYEAKRAGRNRVAVHGEPSWTGPLA